MGTVNCGNTVYAILVTLYWSLWWWLLIKKCWIVICDNIVNKIIIYIYIQLDDDDDDDDKNVELYFINFSGISRSQYRSIIKEQVDFDWTCGICMQHDQVVKKTDY